MILAQSKRWLFGSVFGVVAACGGGDGGGGGNNPPTVASVVITTPAPTIGAFGRTRQLAAEARTAANAVVSGVAFTWNSSNTAVATVDGNGLVTAVSNGTTNVTATGSGQTSAVLMVTVAQVAASITVTSTPAGPDTLYSSARNRQFVASVRDSTNNALTTQPTVAWTSTNASIASVNGTSGLATSQSDGSADITATAGAISGFRTLVVRRLAATHSVTPPTATITTAGGTQVFTGAAADSAGAALALSWSARSTAVVTVTPTGNTTTATASGNGTTRVILSVPAGVVDSASITVSGQPAIPTAASVNVGDDFFRSIANNTQNPAVDTVAVGGTVTWNWVGVVQHSVRSQGSPSFTSSGVQTSGSYQRTFGVAGTYLYDCSVHGSIMTGRVVVR